jgi:hypothetical protein
MSYQTLYMQFFPNYSRARVAILLRINPAARINSTGASNVASIPSPVAHQLGFRLRQ